MAAGSWGRPSVIVASSGGLDDYQVIRLAGSLTLRATRPQPMRATGLTSRRWGKIPHFTHAGPAGYGYGPDGDSDRVH